MAETQALDVLPAPAAPALLFGVDSPVAIVERATAIADALAKVVEQKELFTTIGKGRHVHVEG
jgi:hypothetical protein